MRPPLMWSELEQIRRHAERDYPREACGFVLRRAWAERGLGADWLVMPCTNIMDELHHADAAKYPRDARDGYAISPRDVSQLTKRHRNDWRLHAIYHSHTSRPGAVLSEEDIAGAMGTGEPVYPLVYQVVFSLPDRAAEQARAYRWDPVRLVFLLAGAATFAPEGFQQFPFLPLVADPPRPVPAEA